MIDFHCHLDLHPNPQLIARECADRGVRTLSVTTTPSAWYGTSSLAGEQTWTALGLHPQLAHERKAELEVFQELITQTCYVGEIGLDGGPGFRAHWKDQEFVFNHVLQTCVYAGGRILSIHSRRAASAVLDGLEAHPDSGTAILHWFSGGFGELARAIDLGCWFSVGPTMLKSQKGRRLTARMPRERVLTESDGPFARIGHRAALPWDVEQAVGILASLWERSHEETQQILNDNLVRLIHDSSSLVRS